MINNNKLFWKNPWLGREKIRTTGFSPIDLGLIFGLNIPMIIIHFYFKWIRVSSYGEIDNIIDIFEIFKTDLLLHCIYILFVLATLTFFKNITLKVVSFIALQLLGIIILLLEISAHNYYMITGSMLNYDLLEYALKNIKELKSIVTSMTNFFVVPLFLGSILILLLGPWILAYFITIRENKIQKLFLFNLLPRKRWSTLTLVLIILVLIFTPPLTNKNILFTKNLFFHLAETYYENIFMNENTTQGEWKQPKDSVIEHHLTAIKKNLVLIILESTRSDATSIYNPELKTTPFLKELSKKSLLIENMFSVVPHTSKSLLAINCGIEPKATVGVEESEDNGIPIKCLPTLLNKVGYQTVFFQTATEYFENRRAMIANFGYSEFYPGNKLPKYNYQPTNYFGYEDYILLEASKKWHKKNMKNNATKPFMVTYLTNTTHHNYALPGTHRYQWFHSDKYFNKYLNTVNYVDTFLAKLIQQYKDLGLYNKTIFIFVGDHGEGFREHNIFGHSNIIYREGIQVPFLVHDPTRFKTGLKVSGTHFQPDILPTIIDLLNFRLLNSVHRGKSIFKKRKNYSVYAHCWSKNTCVGRHNKNYKYIHFFNKKPDEFYNLKLDPYELKNIHSVTPHEFLNKWKTQILNWYKNNHKFYETYKTHKLTNKTKNLDHNPL